MSEKKIRENYILYLLAGLVVFFVSVILILVFNPDSDSFFLIKTGELIVQNKGLPAKNPYIIHDIDFFIQQPLTCLLNYIAYKIGGYTGIFALAFVFYTFAIGSVIYALKRNNVKNLPLTIILVNIALLPFLKTRPYPLTFSLLTILSGELYHVANISPRALSKKEYIRFYATVFITSLLQSNIQAASLIFHMLFVLPFVMPKITIKKGSCFKLEPPNNIIVLLLCFPIQFTASLLNPNGINAFLFLFRSLGEAGKLEIIEMCSPRIVSLPGLITISILILFIYGIIRKKLSAVMIYMFLGTFFIGITMQRNIIYLAVFAVFAIHELTKEQDEYLIGVNTGIIRNVTLISASVSMVFITLILFLIPTLKKSIKDISMEAFAKRIAEYDGEVTVYAGFTGQIFEFYNYKVYIDARPENYAPALSGGEDILGEFIEVNNGGLDFNDFVDKYNFSHVIVTECSRDDVYIQHNTGYIEAMREDGRILYERLP